MSYDGSTVMLINGKSSMSIVNEKVVSIRKRCQRQPVVKPGLN